MTTADDANHDEIQIGDTIGTLTVEFDGVERTEHIVVTDTGSTVDAECVPSDIYETIRLTGLHAAGSIISIWRDHGMAQNAVLTAINLDW